MIYHLLTFMVGSMFLTEYVGKRATFFLLSCFGVAIELSQLFIPGRVCCPWDILANTIGILAGIGFMAMVGRDQ